MALTAALILPGLAGAQAVVNTVKLGACDDLLGVCLANPTQRYKHGVFGQPFEYGTILTIDENGAALRPFNLPFEQVFEDRRVRVVDLDDDGLSEVILIVADRNRGAAVALYAFDPGEGETSATVYPMARSAFIDAPNRWLNPLDGAVDLDGDGSVGVSDLLMFNTQYGTVGASPADLDGDGVVAVADLMIILGEFGRQGC